MRGRVLQLHGEDCFACDPCCWSARFSTHVTQLKASSAWWQSFQRAVEYPVSACWGLDSPRTVLSGHWLVAEAAQLAMRGRVLQLHGEGCIAHCDTCADGVLRLHALDLF